jgi:hypothetical protein
MGNSSIVMEAEADYLNAKIYVRSFLKILN